MKTLLTVSDVAEELSLREIEVLRLIALRRLAATPQTVDDKIEYRIKRNSLEALVTAGLQGAAIEFSDGFLAGRDYMLERKVDALVASAVEPAEAVVRALVKAEAGPNGREEDVRIVFYDVTAIPAALVERLNQPEKRFGRDVGEMSLADRYFRSRMIRALEQEAKGDRVGVGAGTAIQRLYASPESYETIVARAFERVQSEAIALSGTRILKYQAPPALYGEPVTLERSVNVSIRVPHRLLYDRLRIRRDVVSIFGVPLKKIDALKDSRPLIPELSGFNLTDLEDTEEPVATGGGFHIGTLGSKGRR